MSLLKAQANAPHFTKIHSRVNNEQVDILAQEALNG